MERFYPIGTPGTPWTDDDKSRWLSERRVQRSYRDDVRDRLDALSKAAKRAGSTRFDVAQYGALTLENNRYPLYAVTLRASRPGAPWALVTGGVHGYETSGVHGALAFLDDAAAAFADSVNLLVVPCVSPWGYEVINRWNPQAMDPNRSFAPGTECEEAAALMTLLRECGHRFLVHLDLHETTDSDEEEFRPAVAARDGEPFAPGLIPDGFYTVGDVDKPAPAFQAAIIEAVSKVTHIAPADAEGNIIGAAVTQPGVINYATKPLGLCAGVTDARFVTTTEVYPDSPRVTAEICNAAQVAAVIAGLEHALAA